MSIMTQSISSKVLVVPRGDKIEFLMGNKTIGVLEKDIFKKRVIKSTHFMKIYKTYGVDLFVVDYLSNSTCRKISIIDDSGEQWLVDLATFLRESFIKDHGHGEQRFLAPKWWMVHNYLGKKMQDGFKVDVVVSSQLKLF